MNVSYVSEGSFTAPVWTPALKTRDGKQPVSPIAGVGSRIHSSQNGSPRNTPSALRPARVPALLVGQDGGVFTDFRGNAPPVCLAQPSGLGRSNEAQLKGQRPDHLHDQPAANGRGVAPEWQSFSRPSPTGWVFGQIILRGNAPAICPNEWPPHKWPGRCPISDLCTIHPARWAGLGKQPGASPLKSDKTTPSWTASGRSVSS